MSGGEALILVAYSARALAFSAARAGYAPLAIDMFGDCDTREASATTIAIEGGLRSDLDVDALICAVDSFVRDYHPIGLVYGSAFDHQPETIDLLSRRIRIFGNDPEVVRRAKDPRDLASLCESLGVNHPEVAERAPNPRNGWLAKLRGGSGGAHVHPVWSNGDTKRGWYFQRRVEGHSISALFLGDGQKAKLVGLSLQWTSPADGAPFRYGGAAGPVAMDAAAALAIQCAVEGLTAALGLKGLNSADFLVSGGDSYLIDLNPRPGATLDIFDRNDAPLVARHIAACEGRSAQFASSGGVRAAEVVYAPTQIVVGVEGNWPVWLADRSRAGTRIAAGDPLCTVLAEGETVESARRLVAARAREAVALFFGESNP